MATDQRINTLVFAYGAKPPVDGIELIDEQISRAHAYYNRLVELERERYGAVCSLRASLCPDVESGEAALSAANEAVDEAVAGIRRRNAAERRKRATADEQRDLGALKELRLAFAAELRAAKASAKANVDLIAGLEAIKIEYDGTIIPGSNPERRTGGKLKVARKECGTYFGTYLEIEKALEQAKKTAGGPVQFRRWTGDGLVAVQIQGGITVAQLRACADLRVRLQDTDKRSRRAAIKILWLRVGTDDDRNPVWAKIPLYYALEADQADGRRANRWNARTLPADAIIMGVQIIRRQVAVRINKEGQWVPYYEWSAHFVVRTDREKPAATSGACGVDVGWRLMPNGELRIGYLVGDDGVNHQLTLPARLIGKFQHSEDIRSIRDGHFEQAKADLKRFAEKNAVPDWFTEATRGIMSWRRKGRMASLIKQWSDQRFAGDELMVERLRQWQAKDAHLWQYERHNLLSAQRTRQRIYRSIAARLRQTYGVIALENCKWRSLLKLPDPESNENVNATARWLQRVASVGMLRACLLPNATQVDGANTTKECWKCGFINEWENPVELIHQCGGCGHECDQDENAARVLLARAKVLDSSHNGGSPQANGTEPIAPNGDDSAARVPESESGEGHESASPGHSNRWKRRKLARSQKVAQVQSPQQSD